MFLSTVEFLLRWVDSKPEKNLKGKVMLIFGVALLGLSLLAGLILGQMLGSWMGLTANVGGVGIAMLLLIFFTHLEPVKQQLSKSAASGILFWNAMYLPIVVAMAAKQNVLAALDGGWLALTAGLGAVGISFLLVPLD